MKFFIAMYDDEDNPYMIFKNYVETAKFFKTSSKVIACNICRKQKKKYKGNYYTLHKIYCDDEIELSRKNINFGNMIKFLKLLNEVEKSI